MDLPLNSMLLTYVFAVLLVLIKLGSDVALNIITSLVTGALLCSYIISISCVLVLRSCGKPLLTRRWSMGKIGAPVNFGALLFLILCFVMNFFPQSPQNIDAKTFNWNIAIVSALLASAETSLTTLQFGAVMLVAVAYYASYGRHVYEGPVVYTRQSS